MHGGWCSAKLGVQMKSSSLFYFGERSASALPSRSRHRARKNAPRNGTVFVVSDREKEKEKQSLDETQRRTTRERRRGRRARLICARDPQPATIWHRFGRCSLKTRPLGLDLYWRSLRGRCAGQRAAILGDVRRPLFIVGIGALGPRRRKFEEGCWLRRCRCQRAG